MKKQPIVWLWFTAAHMIGSAAGAGCHAASCFPPRDLKPHLDGHAPSILHAVARVSSGGSHAGSAGAGCGGDRSAAVWILSPPGSITVSVRLFSQLAQRGGQVDWAALLADECAKWAQMSKGAWRRVGECNGGGQAPFLCNSHTKLAWSWRASLPSRRRARHRASRPWADTSFDMPCLMLWRCFSAQGCRQEGERE